MNPRQLNPSLPDPSYQWANLKSLNGAKDAASALDSGIALINKASPAFGTLYVPPGTYIIDRNLTVPSNVRLVFDYKSIFSVNSGKTLTINGKIDAPFTQVFAGAGTVTWGANTPIVYPQWWGATGDGTTDDTTALTSSITAAAAVSNAGIKGVKLVFPPGKYAHTTITMPTNSNLVLEGVGYGSPSSGATLFYTATTGKQFDLGSGLTTNITFRGLYFLGSGGTNEDNDSLYAASIGMNHIEYCSFNNFGGSAVRYLAGSNAKILEVEAQNCLLAAVPSSYSGLTALRGVLHLVGSETVLNNCNINGVAGVLDANTGRIGNGFMVAIYIGGGVSRILNTVAAFAQVGYYFVSSQHHQVINSRAEYIQGDGFFVAAQQSSFVACRAQDCSHDTDNTYYGFNVTGWSNRFEANAIQSIVFTNKVKAGMKINVGAGTGNTLAVNLTDNGIYGITTRPLYEFSNLNNTPFSVNGLNFRQVLTGVGTQTFNPQGGDFMRLTVNANTTSAVDLDVTTSSIIPYHAYTLVVANSSGATPAITLAAKFDKIAGYSAPANGKLRVITWYYDGTNIIGTSTGDI